MKLNNWSKVLFVIGFLALSVVGFLIKLPFQFRHIDKELHALFYFMAAAFFNFLFANKNIVRHIVIFMVLACFGFAIEYAQEYSNTFFHKRIHGRFDIEDIQANLKGLVLFSICWILYNALLFGYRKINPQKINSGGK